MGKLCDGWLSGGWEGVLMCLVMGKDLVKQSSKSTHSLESFASVTKFTINWKNGLNGLKEDTLHVCVNYQLIICELHLTLNMEIKQMYCQMIFYFCHLIDIPISQT